jgi:CheY-like chemotaxis protein
MPVKLILTDFKMPKLNGFDFAVQLLSFITHLNREQQKVKVKKPLVVFSSAYLSERLRDDLKRKGFVNVIDKPIHKKQLEHITSKVAELYKEL